MRILAGMLLWLFVLLALFQGWALGNISIVLLLALGAVLIATTRVEDLRITVQAKDYLKSLFIKIICYLILMALVLMTVWLSIMPKYSHDDLYREL
jgi:hypothetical protein